MLVRMHVRVAMHVVVAAAALVLAAFTRPPERTPGAERGRAFGAERRMERASGIGIGAGGRGGGAHEKAPGRKCRRAQVSRFSTCLTWLQ